MPVLSVAEISEARQGQWTADGGRSYTRGFRVLTNSPYDGPNTAIQATGINIGDEYITITTGFEADMHAYVNEIRASPEEGDALGWIVTVQYGPYSALWCGGGPKQNPLLQPIDVTWGMSKNEIVADMDLNGKPILNTAGDPWDPPIMEDDPRPIMTVVRNEATWNLPLLVQYRNAINSDPFAGFDPLFVRVLAMSSKSVCHQDVGWYYQSTYEFEFKSPQGQFVGKNGYRRTVYNQGMRAISQTSGQLITPSINGIPITHPIPLTRQGYRAKPTDAPYWNVYQTHPELPFAVFQFDPLAIIGQRTGFTEGYGPPFYGGGG